MTTVSNVFSLLGAMVTAYGLLCLWRRTSDTPSRWCTWLRKLGQKARRWVRFGSAGPIHHTIDSSLAVTADTTGGLGLIRGGTEGERLARLEQVIDALREQQASSSAEAREHTADLIRQRLDDYRTTERANTRRQTLITATGLVMTVAGIVLRILAG
ncbi:MAG: hypothetical protein JWR34_7428 [Mycobacterium sp.]|nr:hypothetical protein [Mycobacterium sp.]